MADLEELQKNIETLTKVIMTAAAEAYRNEVLNDPEAVISGPGHASIQRRNIEDKILGTGKQYKDKNDWVDKRIKAWMDSAAENT